MWIVVYKQDYYPSVIDFQTEEEALKRFDEIKASEFRKEEYINDGKVYIARVERSYGEMNRNVEWYL